MQDRFCLQMVACSGGCGESDGNDVPKMMDVIFVGIAKETDKDYTLTKSVSDYRALIVGVASCRQDNKGWGRQYVIIIAPIISSDGNDVYTKMLGYEQNTVNSRPRFPFVRDRFKVCVNSKKLK